MKIITITDTILDVDEARAQQMIACGLAKAVEEKKEQKKAPKKKTTKKVIKEEA